MFQTKGHSVTVLFLDNRNFIFVLPFTDIWYFAQTNRAGAGNNAKFAKNIQDFA